MMKIIGIDPGRTTGTCEYSEGKFLCGQEFADPLRLLGYLTYIHPDQIVMEDFIIGPRPSAAFEPVALIQLVKWLSGAFNIPLCMQSPSVLTMMKKHVATVHKSPHVRSAAAHVEYFIRRSQ